MKKLYVFGNEYLDYDNFAGKVANEIKKTQNIEIVHCRSPDDLLEFENFDSTVDDVDVSSDLLILDVVKNIKEPILITDISKLKVNNLTSLHDFDLGYFLKLIKELDMNKNIKIIGIPQDGVLEDISMRVKAWL